MKDSSIEDSPFHQNTVPQPITWQPMSYQAPVPTRFAFNAPPSTEQRIILPCRPTIASNRRQGAGGLARALGEAYLVSVPPPLQARGVTQDEWSAFTQDVEFAYTQDQSLALSCSLLSLCMPPLMMIACPLLCHVAKMRRSALAAAFDNFNTAVLNPRGMHARIQKAVQSLKDSGETMLSFMWWIAVSMTEEDAEALKQEAVFLQFQPQNGCFEPSRSQANASCDVTPI